MIALLAAAAVSHAQEWPTKPVKFIVPFPPGGTVDPLARLMAVKLGESLKQQFIVENRPGAGGSIGTAMAAKGPPDGYTMLVGTAPYAIATRADEPYQSFRDVVAAAKAKPDAVTIGSIGNGTLGHLTALTAQQVGGLKLTHVPYAGGGPMTTNMLGGHVELGIGSAALLTPHVRGGKMRALATTGEKRAASLPDVPTLAEQGTPGVVALAWWGIFAPAGTPAPVLEKFWLLGEMQRWGKVVKDHGVKVD
ncbi:MAG: Bug family tripartite tricarboxylate transporter substrate binding protein [Betaproteobacteria bacterium]